MVLNLTSTTVTRMSNKVECSFGMCVCRWGILRQPIFASIGLQKTTALVLCLYRLHNYCIDCRLKTAGSQHDIEEFPAPPLAMDEAKIASNGGIPMDHTDDNESSPEQLLHGGEHFEDVPAHH
jgi:hypothetical protein